MQPKHYEKISTASIMDILHNVRPLEQPLRELTANNKRVLMNND